MERIAGLPFWDLAFDGNGDPDPGNAADLKAICASGITDLVIFSHGWNNSRDVAHRLYQAMFTLLAKQANAKLGVAGVFWPAQRWSDEPEPQFRPLSTGTASLISLDEAAEHSAELEPDTLTGLLDSFPEASDPLNRLAGLLAGPADEESLTDFHQQLVAFVAATRQAGTEPDQPGVEEADPALVDSDDPIALCELFADQLQASGAVLGGPGDGSAGFDPKAGWERARHGAKEMLRQATYWQMKNRAGTVGRRGLGPLLARLHTQAPDLRVHLVGHSFGARLVSYSLTGVKPGASPVRSVVLLQGACSQWLMAPQLPHDHKHGGALAGITNRVNGPIVAVHSRHDQAVGRFYPLASMVARDGTSGLGDSDSRWGGIGANGAQGVDAAEDAIRLTGKAYTFVPQKVLNVDASEVVRTGKPPSGAHSDILHPELAWLILTAGGIPTTG